MSNALTSLSHGAFAEEGCYTVMAGCTVEAHSDGTVVNVLAAVVSSPTIHTDAGVATDGVEAGATIMAGIWLHETFVDILGTVLP